MDEDSPPGHDIERAQDTQTINLVDDRHPDASESINQATDPPTPVHDISLDHGSLATDECIQESDLPPSSDATSSNQDTAVASPAVPICIICKTSDDQPKGFVTSTWNTFKKAAAKRLLLKSDRYRDTTTEVNLQEEMSNAAGYHIKCYSNYTAVKRPSTDSQSNQPLKTRQRSSMPSSNRIGLLKGSCVFCPIKRKTVKGKVEPLSNLSYKDRCDAIYNAAPRSQNERLKAVVSTLTCGSDLLAKEAQYHKSCSRAFDKDVGLDEPKLDEARLSNRQIHSMAFTAIESLIEKEVISDSRAILASSILELYRNEYLSAGGTAEDMESYTAQALMKKVKDRFKERISVSEYDHRKGNFIYNSCMSDAEARASLHNDYERHIHTIRNAALYLRNVIQEMPKWKTPTPTSVETLKTCSPDLPEEIVLFYKTLLCGLREPVGDNKEVIDRKVMAMSSDAVYNTSRGTVRPWKHTVLGLGVGTLTGSKLILRILNRLGNAISYDEVKALETEFAFSSEANEREAPDGVELKPTLGTALAWDNYDVNMDTLDGKNTLHATVGICYQNVVNSTTSNEPVHDIPNLTGSRSGRNRRRFDGREREIEPYYKQLKKAEFDLPVPNESQEIEKRPVLQVIDFYWMLQAEVEKPLPLFPGFWSQFVEDPLPQQKIWYMDPISAPPTRNDVVRETMERTMNVAVETHQEYGVVTYDLAVALKAYSIQALDAPLFDKLLILLGNFHLELAFFGAIGTFINESGAEYLLTETGILAEGSLVGFIHGKFYNRCVRIHDILALVMEKKLYDRFSSTVTQDSRDAIREILENIPEDPRAQAKFLEDKPAFLEHMQLYEEFFQNVMQGELGPTAQYWCMYIYMMNRVHRDLMRAVRMNDIEGYLAALPFVIDIFFALNRMNYARWGVLFLNKIKMAEPQSQMVLQAGAFSIRRTPKNSSRSAVDLTLEQTVNKDAASPMRGIVGFHQSQSAIRRWCISSTQRGMSVTELRNMTGLEIDEQPATQLRSNRVEKDSRQRDALIKAVSETCDPFSAEASTSPHLLNIATGKSAAANTKAYLTATLDAGHERHIKFKEECADDKGRFLRPIQRRKVENFASENGQKRKGKKKGTSTAESLRDVFIRTLIAVSKKTNFDLKYLMSFPVTDCPLSISHSDGSLLKTEKSKLLDKLEGFQHGFLETPLPPINVTLIDGGLLIHSYLSAIGRISSYGNLARSLLGHICSSLGSEVHVLFDTYQPNSLKEGERVLRGADDQPFTITGPEQTPRQNCQKLLQNGSFKDQLARFLLAEWQKHQYGPVIGKKTLVVSHGGKCLKMEFDGVNVNVSHPEHLQGSHEEADTLLAFHAASATGNIIVRASDTDVLVILIGMLGRDSTRSPPHKNIIMDCGMGNKRRYIDVTRIACALDAKRSGLASALPGLHAFTGSDFTSAFYRKGKLKPLELLEKDTSGTLIQFFCSLATNVEPEQRKAEEFICALYGIKDAVDVNEARHMKLCQMSGKIDQEDPLKNVKKVDCALLPPCAKTVKNKLLRAHFVTIVWGHADTAHPSHGLDPKNFGWKERAASYVPDWFSGPALPNCLFEDDGEEMVAESPEDLDSNMDIDEELVGIDDSGSELEWSDDSESESETDI